MASRGHGSHEQSGCNLFRRQPLGHKRKNLGFPPGQQRVISLTAGTEVASARSKHLRSSVRRVTIAVPVQHPPGSAEGAAFKEGCYDAGVLMTASKGIPASRS